MNARVDLACLNSMVLVDAIYRQDGRTSSAAGRLSGHVDQLATTISAAAACPALNRAGMEGAACRNGRGRTQSAFAGNLARATVVRARCHARPGYVARLLWSIEVNMQVEAMSTRPSTANGSCADCIGRRPQVDRRQQGLSAAALLENVQACQATLAIQTGARPCPLLAGRP